MPELPEVETIRRNLRSSPLMGRTILGVDLRWPRTLAEPGPLQFADRIIGQTFVDIGRRGKFLVFTLSGDFLLVHLRMSGDLFLEPAGDPPASHHRLILLLDEGLRLAFNDTRKFGRVWLVSDPQTVFKNLGPEPLDPGFTPELLYQRLQSARRQLKPLLMDQTFLAGLGNIYTDEALHLAKLHPLMPSQRVTFTQAKRLWEAIRKALEEGIYRQGASIDWVYRGGDFQNYLRAYGRAGLPCPVCGEPIVRLVVGQRGTHICPVCQTLQE